MSASNPHWSRQRSFLYAAIGAAVGLGNIWRFPYMAGENGGGAFVLIYLFFVVCLCIPLVVTELYIGQRGRRSPIGSMAVLCERFALSRFWIVIGVNCLLISFLVFSFYSVIASWSMDYIAAYLSKGQGAIIADASGHFRGLLGSAERLIAWQTLLIGATAAIVALGIRDGLEKALGILVPGLFFILIVLVLLGAVVGEFAASVRFLLTPDFSKISAQTWLMALGQAFFSVAIGGGAMMTYGAYLPPEGADPPRAGNGAAQRLSLTRLAITICAADSAVALLAGFAIFPFVFANNIDPQAGAGLIFIVLPTAFAEFTAGPLIALAFFVLLVFAALSTTIALLEPLVAFCVEKLGLRRVIVALMISLAVWLFGIFQSLSFNALKDWHPLAFLPLFRDMNLFAVTELFASTVLLPVNCLLIALFVGWVLLARQPQERPLPASWWAVVRYLAPLAIVAVLLFGLQQH